MEAKLDLAYAGTENLRQRLDLFLPKNRDAGKKLPVLVFIDGGAWQAGSKEDGRGQVMRFVAEGKCAGVSIGYRLSQEAKWPAQIHDCKAAIRWIKAHGEEHGMDGERIVVWGASAGGHLVAVLGTSAGVAEMDGKLGPHGQSKILQAELKKAGVANELYTVKGGGHGGFRDPEVPRKVEAFLQKQFLTKPSEHLQE